jgi:DNA-binding LacI/PurR family transcriptional regulator
MKSRYQSVAKMIRSWIDREGLTEGSRLPSANILAERLEMSPTTVLRAAHVLVAERVLERQGYKLIVRAKEWEAVTVTGAVYVISYNQEFTLWAHRILSKRGLNSRPVEVSWAKRSTESTLRKVLEEKPAGVILHQGTPLDKDTLALLKEIDLPMVVCADGGLRPSRQSSVQVDCDRATENALGHLVELGHRHVCHVPFFDGYEQVQAECYRAACRNLNLRSSANMVWWPESGSSGVEAALIEGRRRHPEVTALFCHDRIALRATQIFDVPAEISVVGTGGMPEGLECDPPLTTVMFRNHDCVVRWACSELISQLEAQALGRPLPPLSQAFFVPQLVVRESTRARAVPGAARKTPSKSFPKKPMFKETWQTIYPLLKKRGSNNWLQLDLRKLANHSITRQNGWLGAEPLYHFPPGLRSIHGVPFRVLDENENDGRAVVTFRSPHAHSAGEKELPGRAKIKVNSRVKAFYFLHGCGWAASLPFAQYIMHYGKGKPSSVDLIPLGHSGRKELERRGLHPNLQDWWMSFEPEDFPHAHRASIFDPDDPAEYERTLYSLEWTNPRPEEEISFIEVRVDPEAGPSLALIAVTALL